MLFGRKNPFSSTDAFPLSDAVLEFDDSSSGEVRRARRTLDGFGVRAQLNARHQWAAAMSAVLLFGLALAAFVALEVVDSALWVWTAATAVLGVFAFWMLTRSDAGKKLRHRHLQLCVVGLFLGAMLVLVYVVPVTQILLAPFAFVALSYGVFAVPRRMLLTLCALAFVAYGLVIWLHHYQRQDYALLRLELLHWIALVLSLPVFVAWMGKVQRLYRSLDQASRKIKNIQEDAKRDTLVGCFNRRYVLAALEEQKQLADETGIPLCLAVLDIDHFKRINDELGHLGGDEVLRTFSRIAQQGVRGGDVFGRYGGEEFLLIFPATSLLPALNTCERIRAQVESHAWNGLLRARVTVSIGVTQYVMGESVLEFFSRADTAMYMAKEGGRNQVVVEEPVLRGDSLVSDSAADSA
jgi:diguanylate cyclase (GGDEF)-like protein